MPQLDTSTFMTQIFWLLTSFITLWVIMDKLIIPKIAEMVEARKRKYEDYVRVAEEMNEKALLTLKNYEDKLAVAKKNVNSEIEENKIEINKIINEKQQEINKQMQEKISENELLIEKIKKENLSNIKQLTIDMACMVSRKLGLDSINKEDFEKIINADTEEIIHE